MALSRDTLVDALREFAADLGEPPTRAQMNDDGPYSAGPYYRVLDSWNDALRAAGLEPNHENDVSDDRLIAALQRLAEAMDRVPRFEDMAAAGDFSPHTYTRRWGSWLAAKDAAGLCAETRTSRRVERDELVRAMRELAAEVGGAPTQTEMNERGEFSKRPYYREWDSWGEALAAAGVERNSERVHGIDDEQLQEALRELSRAVGRPPTAEMMNDRGQFSVYPYLRRWGTWNDALRAAGFGINKAWGGVAGVLDYGPDWPDRRREALERDDWSCVLCNYSNDAHVERYGQGLDVHHRRKFRSFESAREANRLENLVTLCRDCHANVERGGLW
jgi:hypothetical protein